MFDNRKDGAVIDRDGELAWSKSGRPLTEWEKRARLTRTDVWLHAFDGNLYRFFFPVGAEEALGRSIAAFGSFARDTSGGVSPTHGECLTIIEAALAHGGARAVEGRREPLSPREASNLVAHHAPLGPVEDLHRLVKAIVIATVWGRPATDAERDVYGAGDSGIVPTREAVAA